MCIAVRSVSRYPKLSEHVFVLLHDGGEEKMVLHFFLMSIGVQSLIHHAYNSYEDVIPPRFRFRHKRLATLMVPSVKLFRVQ